MVSKDSTTASWSNTSAASAPERRISLDSFHRLRSVIEQLPLADLPPWILNVGCGDYPSAAALRETLPGWTCCGIDLDGEALARARRRTPGALLIQADGLELPFAEPWKFGLILVRHPDVFRRRTAWSRLLPGLPDHLAPGGVVLITLFTQGEVDLVRRLAMPARLLLDENLIAPVDLAGQDRFVLVYRAESVSLTR